MERTAHEDDDTQPRQVSIWSKNVLPYRGCRKPFLSTFGGELFRFRHVSLDDLVIVGIWNLFYETTKYSTLSSLW